jgi:hypothetical protein
MNNSENYPWTAAYVSAALETDVRLITHVQIDRPEHSAIQAARMGLATMKAEWVAESRSIFFGEGRSH